MKNYLLILFAAGILTSCTNQRTTKSQKILELDGDPSPVIMQNMDYNNRAIANTTSRVPDPSRP